ncbi:hypothetical protein [Streptomyces sp. BE303]|uniref:hypothetical protein n=1 Tax=Streptomyces sp. BE303 TaxID=3002528 RepID=UPI002E759A3F|nr:hypothetical protein [Streptomyces sp. BE303]MED7955147.1 hypothetical protein [Streptomyces sp. BE303]
MPVGLAPWAGTLSALTPELALALGPLLRHLDSLVGEREPVADGPGSPEGLGGLGRTGRPDQLLPTEWLLAEEYPDEFLRRFADRELLYLAPELRTTVSRGRTVALVDTGPAQAGPGRLVQLAALLVLHRRAAVRGTELVVGVLGDPPDRWLTGDLAELLPAWLRSRRPADPTPEDVDRARQALDAADRAWLLTSPRLAARLPARPRVLTSETTRWGTAGATHVTVLIDRSQVELALPAGEIAVRALRGAEFRRSGPGAPPAVPPSEAFGATGGALPAFTTESRTLVARGASTDVLLAVGIPDTDHLHPTVLRAKRHRLHGPVVAAGRAGRRLIALQLRKGHLIPYVSGRPFGSPGDYRADPADLGLDGAELARLLTRPLLPLLRTGGDLLLPVAGRWRRLAADGTVTDDGPVGRGAESPSHFNRFREPRLFERRLQPDAARARHLLHAGGTVAWSEDGKRWTVWTRLGDERRLSFRENAEVLGLVHDRREPALITWSPGVRTLRAVRADGVRTLSRFSGGPTQPAMHPTLPLIAAETASGRIVIGDAVTGRIRHFLWSNR